MCYRRLLCILLAGLNLTAGLMFAQSQANTGTIEGVVNDPSGRAVPGATGSLTNTGPNFSRILRTDDEGRFRGLLLPLGPYKVTIKAANFGTMVREGLDLAVGQTITLTLPLSLSQVEQVVSVTGEAPIIETGRVEGSTYMNTRLVEDLPN